MKEFREYLRGAQILNLYDLIGYWNSELTEDELDNVLILKKGKIK